MEEKGSELFVVDNSSQEWKVYKYLHEWCDLSKSFDIATAYFEIGALLSLDGEWQKLEKIRILMGDEVSKRTKTAFANGLSEIKSKLDNSIESEKELNLFLIGLPAIIEAIKTKKIECKVYTKAKFHAKAYITHAKKTVIGSAALVGSSNFTYPGLHDNVELNIQIRREVETLQKWFEDHWAEAEDVSLEILKVIERHVREYKPFEIYLKALYEYHRGHEITATEWEKEKSLVFKVLDNYQKQGYQALMKISNLYNGAFLCDSVGLGKTFIGLMLIERMLFYDRKRVALVVTKSARIAVWETKLKTYLPSVLNGFMPFKIFNHTDLLRQQSGDINWPEMMRNIQDQADVIIIDEAHNFRNRSSERYRKLYDVIGENKKVFLLTATPINNSLLDLQHQIELFSRRDEQYFKNAPLGINSLRGHFQKMENALEKIVSLYSVKDANVIVDEIEAEKVLKNDVLFKTIVVQRSRAYVKKLSLQEGGTQVFFPERDKPRVEPYSLIKVYGELIKQFEKAFNKKKPLLNLPIYYPYAYYKGSDKNIDPMKEGRQKQVVALIRILLLKRFESSVCSFYESCEDLLLRLFAFVKRHNPKQASIWEGHNAELIKHIKKINPTQPTLFDEEDSIPEELLEYTDQLNPEEFDISEIVLETIQDLDQLAIFINELRNFNSKHDDKIQNLIKLLENDPDIKNQKLIIFTEFKSTAKYIYKEMKDAGFKNIEQIDGETADRLDVIERFAPYYNGSSSEDLKKKGMKEIQILISTDVLAEGLNLQDATCLINYDLHWNPVRLMQRIGRIDRRLDNKIEEIIKTTHPETRDKRGKIYFWNFLPPDEVNEILTLYSKVSSKTLRISKTFGIEGKKLLTPEDNFEALREFNANYEGQTSLDEELNLEYQKLLSKYPLVAGQLANMPLKIYSGKEDINQSAKGVFFCYRLPAKNQDLNEWTEDAGYTKWYFYNTKNQELTEDIESIHRIIKTEFDEKRKLDITNETLSEIIKKIEKHINNTYFRATQAPIEVKPILKAWMQVS